MVAYQKFNIFVEDVCEGVHDLGSDQLELALVTSGDPPVAADVLLANLTGEIAYTNLDARTVTVSSSAQDPAGTYKIKITDKVLTASGGVATFQNVAVFNQGTAVKTDPLIAWYDHGSGVTLASGETFTVDFNDSDGFFQLV